MSINWEIIAALAESLSALAVMASLIYVGVQVRGDRQARVAATIQARQEGRNKRDFSCTGDFPGIRFFVGQCMCTSGK